MKPLTVDDIVGHNYDLMISSKEGGMLSVSESIGGTGGSTIGGTRNLSHHVFFFDQKSGFIYAFHTDRPDHLDKPNIEVGAFSIAWPGNYLDVNGFGIHSVMCYRGPKQTYELSKMDNISPSAVQVLRDTKELYNQREIPKIQSQIKLLGRR